MIIFHPHLEDGGDGARLAVDGEGVVVDGHLVDEVEVHVEALVDGLLLEGARDDEGDDGGEERGAVEELDGERGVLAVGRVAIDHGDLGGAVEAAQVGGEEVGARGGVLGVDVHPRHLGADLGVELGEVREEGAIAGGRLDEVVEDAVGDEQRGAEEVHALVGDLGLRQVLAQFFRVST